VSAVGTYVPRQSDTNPRLRDRSPPTLVTRTSSVRAGIGDDWGEYTAGGWDRA